MKKYNVTVNGTVYEVMVEEADGASLAAAPAAPAAAPVAAPAAAPAPKTAPAPKATGAQGAVKVTAPMPGTVLKMSIKVGDVIEPNGLVCILEAMKMENEIFTEKGGKVVSIDAPVGTAVQSGDVIVTLA